MLSNTNGIYSDTVTRLVKEINNCDFRIEETQERTAELNKLTGRIEQYVSIIDEIEAVQAELKPMIRDITTFISDKRSKSLNSLRSAISASSSLIPDAANNIDVVIDGDELELGTTDDMDVGLLEGSGYKGLVSVFMRINVLRENKQYLQLVILDEPFSKLSGVKSSDLAEYLPLLAKLMAIVLIEHKEEIRRTESDCYIYTFFKDEVETTITCEER